MSSAQTLSDCLEICDKTKMHCMKLLGQRLTAREFDRQVAKLHIRMAVMNGYTALGIPVTETVG